MTTRTVKSSMLAGLAADRALLAKSSTTERVAEILRERVIEGLLPPGSRLSEDAISAALGVSRNTLREAFRLLIHEHLVVHELNRGVFVRTLTEDDVVDLFRVRRIIESAAIAAAGTAGDEALSALRAAVAEGERAAAEGRGSDIGTANMRFHQAIAALAASTRIDEIMRQVLAELRLVFHVMDEPHEFHQPYLERNRQILALLEAGKTDSAQDALTAYLEDAERQLREAHRSGGSGSAAV